MLGAARAALMAARLAPAVAMQPPAPPMFRRTLLDRLMTAHALRQTTIMVLRSIIRWPVRSFLTATGLGAATSAVIAAGFMGSRSATSSTWPSTSPSGNDAMILFAQDVPRTALPEVARLPGVIQVEPQQYHGATLRNGPREKRVALEARPPDATLSRVIGADGTAISAPPGGILLSERLAAALELSVGDPVEVEFMTGLRETHALTVTGLVEQFLGLGAYADIDFLDAQFRRSEQMSVVNVLVDPEGAARSARSLAGHTSACPD
jgi:putative ABC transport system permease protein